MLLKQFLVADVCGWIFKHIWSYLQYAAVRSPDCQIVVNLSLAQFSIWHSRQKFIENANKNVVGVSEL